MNKNCVKKPAKPFTIVFTGGGSGGHVSPNLALIAHIKKIRPEADIHYIGTGGIEKKLAADKAVFHEITARKFYRSWKKLGRTLLLPFSLIRSVLQSKKILRKICPDVVFSKGGYVGLPVVMAAKSLGIRTISHESDTSMGLANKIAMRFSDLFFSSFPIKKSGVVVSGSPLNQEIYRANAQAAREICGFDKEKKVLVVTGGSLGAIALNEFVKQNFTRLAREYAVVLICGKNKKIDIPNGKNFYQIEYTDKIHHFFALADLCLTRAGSNTLCELIALGVPFICVPLGEGSRGEQRGNAKYLAGLSGGRVLEEKDLNYEAFRASALETEGHAVPEIDGTGMICDYILGGCCKN